MLVHLGYLRTDTGIIGTLPLAVGSKTNTNGVFAHWYQWFIGRNSWFGLTAAPRQIDKAVFTGIIGHHESLCNIITLETFDVNVPNYARIVTEYW
jgi:hypothetical protein